MSRRFDIGDRIICTESGVSGICEKFYYPTACEEQTMVETADGRHYHAPTRTWKKVDVITTMCFPRNSGQSAIIQALIDGCQKNRKHGLMRKEVKDESH